MNINIEYSKESITTFDDLSPGELFLVDHLVKKVLYLKTSYFDDPNTIEIGSYPIIERKIAKTTLVTKVKELIVKV